jgi:hypothetical protein
MSLGKILAITAVVLLGFIGISAFFKESYTGILFAGS